MTESPRSRRNRLARERRAKRTCAERDAIWDQNWQAQQVVLEAPVLAEVPLAQRVVDGSAGGLRHAFGHMNIVCSACNALHWLEERVHGRGSTLTNPIFTMCCEQGKVCLGALSVPPEPLKSLLLGGTQEAKRFRDSIRAYNNALAFTSLGAHIDERFSQGGNYTFRLQGALYHRMGSLLPAEGENHKFAQLYIVDNQATLNGRMATFENLDQNLMERLQNMLSDHNPYAQLFENVRARLVVQPAINLELRLLTLRSKDRRMYNTPTADEVGAIMVGNGHDGSLSERDIIVKRINGPLQRISSLHSAYSPLHYVLFFPRGCQGWSPYIPLQGFDEEFVEVDHIAVRGKSGSCRVTQMQFYAHVLHPRNAHDHIFYAGRLLQQYMVDAWACVEQNRLKFFQENQKDLQCELYSGIMDALNVGDYNAAQIGQKFILPSSFAGGRRQMNQLYQDVMAIVRTRGRPHVFLTFTCNPKWTEIAAELLPGQTAKERPDLVARVFKMKFDELMMDLKHRKIFGEVLGQIWVIEFQKRGLPHALILLILDEQSELKNVDEIDSAVCAEIPDPITHPEAYETVTRCLIHGPCGAFNPNAPCMLDGKCTKRYPHKFARETNTDDNGYHAYRRRDNGRFFVDNKGNSIDNRWIVPHNVYLATKYNAHINVEVCSSITAVKYLFKYVYKGHDRTTAILQSNDEIKQYIDACYVSASEAAWRLFGFRMHDQSPSIQRLQVHLPDQQHVTFNANGNLAEVVATDQARKTTLTEWFEANRTIPLAHEISYLDFSLRFTWQASGKKWVIRIKGYAVGRLYSVSPLANERYFLRTLLTVVKGATCFESLRTFNGETFNSFKAACVARGLYEDDTEWERCLQEAAGMQSGAQLRSLFVTILTHGPPANPLKLWEDFYEALSDDCAHHLRQNGVEQVSETQKHSFTLNLIAQLLAPYDKFLEDFNLPKPAFPMEELQGIRFILEELDGNVEELREKVQQQIPTLNVEQRDIYDRIMQSCSLETCDKIYFIDSPGRTGKTYLENLLLRSIRSQNQIALALASSDIAALLLEKGRTAHSRLKIPLELDTTSVCSIRRQGELAELIRHTKLILWDEAPMVNKLAFKAVDRTLRDITGKHVPFEGIAFVMCGDFRQVLLVVPKGLRPDIVAALIKELYLWRHIEVHSLRQNMRILGAALSHVDLRNRTFANWLLALGESNLQTMEGEYVSCPKLVVLKDQSLDGLITLVYPGLGTEQHGQEYFSNRAIFTTRNDDVARINAAVLDRVHGQA